MSKIIPQVITCKAAVIWGIGEGLKVEEIQIDPPKSSEVRVKMLYASICHSDVTRTYGYPFPLFPRVLGHEGVGKLQAVEGAKMHGATKIIGIDKNRKKKEKAEAFGMTDFINPDEFDKPISQLVKDLTDDGIGVDYWFACSGSAPLVNQALRATKLGKGKAIVMGSGHDSVNIDFLPLLSGRTLKGSVFGGLSIKSDLPILLQKCKNKEFHLDELLTHEISLQDIDKAFELLEQPDCVKVVVKIQ